MPLRDSLDTGNAFSKLTHDLLVKNLKCAPDISARQRFIGYLNFGDICARMVKFGSFDGIDDGKLTCEGLVKLPKNSVMQEMFFSMRWHNLTEYTPTN